AEFAELADRFDQARAETVDVRAALYRRNQVHIAFIEQLAPFGQPEHGPIDGFSITLHRTRERLLGQTQRITCALFQVIGQAIFVIPLVAARLLAARGVVDERDAQAWAQHGLGAQ